jgi:hypothetical protein
LAKVFKRVKIMAKAFINEKGFKIIECSALENVNLGGGMGICDFCGNHSSTFSTTGYYIAVLNSWYCEDCYNEWVKGAINYPSDRKIEDRNFEMYKDILGIN